MNRSDRGRKRLDELEHRLCGPKRIALFGHRAVGKTTLLAMFYRQASGGQIPDLRMSAGDAATALFLGELVAAIESGTPAPATLAETDLRLRIYRGETRLELDLRDYQGEHTELGSDQPIRDFFAGCDAVFLCLDPEGNDRAQRQMRQHEVEALLERFIEVSEAGLTDRPVALLLTKYDRVIARGGPPPHRVEELADTLYGMTLHTLTRHAPASAIFAVSALGHALEPGSGQKLQPLGLAEPLYWLVDQLEARDRDLLSWIEELVPKDRARLDRCIAACAQRYGSAAWLTPFRQRQAARRRRTRRRGLAAAGLAVLASATLAIGYDTVGFHQTQRFTAASESAVAIANRWTAYLRRHPLVRFTRPDLARRSSELERLWSVRATGQRVAAQRASEAQLAALDDLKIEHPELASEIARVQDAADNLRHDTRWRELQAADLEPDLAVVDQLDAYRSFLREFPDSPHRETALTRFAALEAMAADVQERSDREDAAAIERALAEPDVDLTAVIERANAFLERNPRSVQTQVIERLRETALTRRDEQDIQRARDFSRQFPTSFATRRRRYEDYLATHHEGGRHTREALDALAAIDRHRDIHTYRKAYDHALEYPTDAATVAQLLQAYLETEPGGRFVGVAQAYLEWWRGIQETGSYRVTLRRGAVDTDVGKFWSRGGPNLGVELWVNGVRYGPSSIAPNTHEPIWDYTYKQPVRWKYGDRVVIRVLDYDWPSSGSGVFQFRSAPDDPLAMRFLDGEIRPATKGGRTSLVFESDFRIPKLPDPGPVLARQRTEDRGGS